MNWLFSHTWVSFNKRECCCGLVWNHRCVPVSFQDEFKGSVTLLAVCHWEACSQEWQLTFLSYVWKWPGLNEDLQRVHWLPTTNHSVPLECSVSLHSPISQCTSPSSKGAPSNPMCLSHGTSDWGTADLDKDWDWVSSADWLITPGTENSALTGSECSVCTCCTTRKMKSETLTSNDFYVELTSGTENFNSVQCKNQISVWCSAQQCLGSCVQ